MNSPTPSPIQPVSRSCFFMSDREIQQRCELTSEQRASGMKPLISPFLSESSSTLPNGMKCPSFGLTSFGYDIRLSNTFDIRRPSLLGQDPNSNTWNHRRLVEYKNSKDFVSVLMEPTKSYIDFAKQSDNIEDSGFERFTDVEWIKLPPHSFTLAVSKEHFNVPLNSKGICMGKSTVARNGLIVVVTPLEPGWSGFLTLEIFNATDAPVCVYAGMGITQIMFAEENTEPNTSYGKRAGKYQDQQEVPVHAKLK